MITERIVIMRRFLTLIGMISCCMLLMSGCSEIEQKETEDNTSSDSVTILYTNDVHTYIHNTETDDEGNETMLLTYGSVAALRDSLEEEGKNVLLLDAGDHVQGTIYGGIDEGKTIIRLMNALDYDAATLGNHEFDYGQFRMFEIMDEADYPYLSCNFYSTETDENVLPAYKILEAGDVKVAVIGISTPDTLTSAAPAYFQDESGNFIYDFRAGEDGSDLYESVQAAIDEIGDSADYIIALGHLGVDPSSEPYTSREVIEHTHGLDAFIDGHSHTTMEGETVADDEGNPVLLTQTGSYLAAIGEMTLSPEGITTELITEVEGRDETIEAIAEELMNQVDEEMGRTVSTSDITFTIMDSEDSDVRVVRRQETNIGDLMADSIYWYFNEKMELDCDIAIVNGGGLRTNLEAGEITLMDLKNVQPFGNVLCLMDVSGQQIMDMLEWSVRCQGLTDDQGNPAEDGGFLQVAGLRFQVDVDTESTVQADYNDIWCGSPTGEYRVHDVEIYDRSLEEYVSLELEKKYSLAGINYLLRNQGNGYAMFDDEDLILDYVTEDYLASEDYLAAFTAGEDGIPSVSSKNSPLASYTGYQLDYEQATGSERIKICQ